MTKDADRVVKNNLDQMFKELKALGKNVENCGDEIIELNSDTMFRELFIEHIESLLLDHYFNGDF